MGNWIQHWALTSAIVSSRSRHIQSHCIKVLHRAISIIELHNMHIWAGTRVVIYNNWKSMIKLGASCPDRVCWLNDISCTNRVPNFCKTSATHCPTNPNLRFSSIKRTHRRTLKVELWAYTQQLPGGVSGVINLAAVLSWEPIEIRQPVQTVWTRVFFNGIIIFGLLLRNQGLFQMPRKNFTFCKPWFFRVSTGGHSMTTWTISGGRWSKNLYFCPRLGLKMST